MSPVETSLTDAELDRLDAAVAAWGTDAPEIMVLIGRAVRELRAARAENADLQEQIDGAQAHIDFLRAEFDNR